MRWTTRKLNFMLTNLQEYILTVLDHKGECSIPDIENALSGHLKGVDHGVIYNTLTRLGDDYTVTRIREPLSKRGGRAAKLYTLTKTGREALKEARESRASIMESFAPKRPKPRRQSISDQKPRTE